MTATVISITPIPFQFEGLSLSETCWIGGKPHYTRRCIAEFLEYSGPQPQKAVDKIIERNPYIQQWATTVNLTVVEGGRFVTRDAIEVYDPIGLQLICMESRQPKAIQYKIAVAHLVWAYVNGQLPPSKWADKGARLAALRQIGSLPGGRDRMALKRDLARLEGVGTNTINQWLINLGYRCRPRFEHCWAMGSRISMPRSICSGTTWGRRAKRSRIGSRRRGWRRFARRRTMMRRCGISRGYAGTSWSRRRFWRWRRSARSGCGAMN